MLDKKLGKLTGEVVSMEEANDRSLYTLQSMLSPATSTSSLSTVTVTINDSAPEEVRETMWEGVLAVEGVRTDDNSAAPRVLLRDSLTWRELPIPLMAQLETGEGHDGAQVAGQIQEVWREPREFQGAKTTAIMGRGTFDSGEFGQEVARLVGEETLRGVSVDLVATEWSIADGETFDLVDETVLDVEDILTGNFVLALTAGGIGAATITPVQALADATIALVASSMTEARLDSAFGMSVSVRALTASAAGLAPLAPPREWFEVPEADTPTPLTVTEDGRVFGHLALWGACHTAFDSCELAPRSNSQYAYFHTGQIKTAEGDLLNVGRLTVGKTGQARGGHASIVLGAKGAIEHYDSTGCTAAFVRATDGVLGIWLSGAVRSDAPAEKIRDLRAHPPSGDWRPEKGGLELVAALAVPVGGFPIPRYEARLVASGGVEELTALIATGYVPEVLVRTRADIRKLAVLGRKAREALAGDGARDAVRRFPNTLRELAKGPSDVDR